MLPILDFEGFTKEETAGIFSYLEEKGATGYILLYNEAYFTGIPEEPEIPAEPVNPNPTQPAVPNPPAQPTQPVQPAPPSEQEEPEEEPEITHGNDGFDWVDQGPGIKDLVP